MISFAFGGVLVAVWVLLWGSFSVANLLSGIAVTAAVIYLIPDLRFTRRQRPIRPVATARFAAVVLVELVRANAVVTREILTPRSQVRTGVVEVPLPSCSDGVLTVVANVLALAPGTMPVEVRTDPMAIYVHVLHLHSVDRVRADVQRLALLAVAAFGTDEAIEATRSSIATVVDAMPGDDGEAGER